VLTQDRWLPVIGYSSQLLFIVTLLRFTPRRAVMLITDFEAPLAQSRVWRERLQAVSASVLE
jgi:hypothetical protein